jgi:hypothetical protein
MRRRRKKSEDEQWASASQAVSKNSQFSSYGTHGSSTSGPSSSRTSSSRVAGTASRSSSRFGYTRPLKSSDGVEMNNMSAEATNYSSNPSGHYGSSGDGSGRGRAVDKVQAVLSRTRLFSDAEVPQHHEYESRRPKKSIFSARGASTDDGVGAMPHRNFSKNNSVVGNGGSRHSGIGISPVDGGASGDSRRASGKSRRASGKRNSASRNSAFNAAGVSRAPSALHSSGRGHRRVVSVSTKSGSVVHLTDSELKMLQRGPV